MLLSHGIILYCGIARGFLQVQFSIVKPVLSGHPWGPHQCPLNTGSLL